MLFISPPIRLSALRRRSHGERDALWPHRIQPAPSLFPLPASSFSLPDSNTTGCGQRVFDSGSATLAVLVTSGPQSPASRRHRRRRSGPSLGAPTQYRGRLSFVFQPLLLLFSCFLLPRLFLRFIRFKSFLKGLGCSLAPRPRLPPHRDHSPPAGTRAVCVTPSCQRYQKDRSPIGDQKPNAFNLS